MKTRGQASKLERNAVRDRILAHLNLVTGSKFRDSAGKISARIEEGYSEELLMAIIDMKFQEWGSDPEMQRFLRPDTLFGPKTIDRYASPAEKWLQNGRGRPRDAFYAKDAPVEGFEGWKARFVQENGRLPTWREEQDYANQGD